MSIIHILLFVLGAIVGSFLNVVALRYNTGISLGGHSSCATCRKPLGWWELIPIFGFVLLRGRCAGCRSKISPQYPLVELLTGLVFATVFFPNASIPINVLRLLIFCLYIVILIYDARHTIIPDGLVFASIVLALVLHLFFIHFHAHDWWAGGVLFAFFASVWALSRGRAMGFGDAKLGLSIGLFLGLAEGVSAMILAFWIGTVVSLSLMLISRKKLTMKSEVPFAPFMIIGAWLALILHLDLFHVLSLF